MGLKSKRFANMDTTSRIYLRTPKPWLTGLMAVKIVHGRVPEELRQNLHHYLNDNIDQFRGSVSFPTGQNQHILSRKSD